MRDYTAKTVFLGLDVHKKTYAVTAVCEGQVVKKCTMSADPSALIAHCKKYYPGAKIVSAYEAGFCGFHLHRCLEAAGIKNLVVDAASIEVAVGDRVKTDKRDSLKIATHLSQGRLRSIHIPSPEREARRTVTRLRDNCVRERSRLGNQLKSLLFLNGLIKADDKRKVSKRWLATIQALDLTPELKFTVNKYAELWLGIDAHLTTVNLQLGEQAKSDPKLEAVYKSVPGIGPTSARVLANELEDTLQFQNERQLFSFIGLTPTEHSSGENVRQGHITRQGRPLLRKILTQVAWMAIRRDPALREIFTRLMNKTGAKKAIVGIARRIAGRIRACFRTGTLYCIGIKQEEARQRALYELEAAQIAG
jgi:transposase